LKVHSALGAEGSYAASPSQTPLKLQPEHYDGRVHLWTWQRPMLFTRVTPQNSL
jgi:hypothetical protein